MDQSELLAVDDLPFLPLLDPLDRQTHLLFELIVGAVEEIETRVCTRTTVCTADIEYSRGIGGVIDKRLGNIHVFGKTGDEVDVPLAVPIDGGSSSRCSAIAFLNSSLRLGISARTASRSLREA